MTDVPWVRLLSFRQAGKLVGVGRDTMARWIESDGNTPLHRDGRFTRVMYGDLVRMMERRGMGDVSLKQTVRKILEGGSHAPMDEVPVEAHGGRDVMRAHRVRSQAADGR